METTMHTLLLLLLLLFSPLNANEKPIVVIIPSYNNSHWYQTNLDSILKQRYTNFKVIYLDDASTDGTGTLVQDYLSRNDPTHKVTLIQNQKQIGALANLYNTIWTCHPSDIIVTVDGDDWLLHDKVLKTINKAYSNPDIWMTYGRYAEYPSGKNDKTNAIPQDIIQQNSFREYKWVTSHLRTFYAGLFQHIKKEDLLYKDSFFPVTWDLAMMFPMLEMAGPHSHYIPDILYVYNRANPLSDYKLHKKLQTSLNKLIRAKPRYTPIDTLY
jgi:glycosyltransferase involved in cell wall biosynthesis